MTHLPQIMLEELERRNYAPGTIRAYIARPSQSTLEGGLLCLPGLKSETWETPC